MFDVQGESDIFSVKDALEALGDLEQNTSDAIIGQRESERVPVRTKILVYPGNSSQRSCSPVRGLTGDISNGGCLVLMGGPLMVGDIYWLEFPGEQISIESLFARCLRCRFVREDTFEVGFRFFNEIDLVSAVQHQNDHEW